MATTGGTTTCPSTSSTPSSPRTPYRVSTRTPTSFVFTSSKYYAPDGSLIAPHNRPALPPALLRRHSAHAHNSADFGRILPGFVPLPLPPPPGTPSPPPGEAAAADPFAFLPPRMKPACPHPPPGSEGTSSASPTLVSAPSSASSSDRGRLHPHPQPQPKQSMSELLARGARTEKDAHRGRAHGRRPSPKPKAQYNPDGTRRDPLVVAAHHIELKNRHADETAVVII